MTGIEKITARIKADADAEVSVIQAEAQAQAAEITARYQAEAAQASADILSRGKANADDREERLASAAGMQSRQLLLKARQEMLDAAFDVALEQLQTMPEDKSIALLAQLAAKASTTGKEQIILGKGDRAKGEAVVKQANALLGEKGKLTLSDREGSFKGGLVLSDGEVEVNCTFQTLVRLARGQMAGEVAKVLFD